MTWLDKIFSKLQGIFPGIANMSHFSPVSPTDYTLKDTATGHISPPGFTFEVLFKTLSQMDATGHISPPGFTFEVLFKTLSQMDVEKLMKSTF